jgi:GNAT superfamily N-acetyltransferase
MRAPESYPCELYSIPQSARQAIACRGCSMGRCGVPAGSADPLPRRRPFLSSFLYSASFPESSSRRFSRSPKAVGDSPAELWRLYVDRPWHGKGVAQTLMQSVTARRIVAGANALARRVGAERPHNRFALSGNSAERVLEKFRKVDDERCRHAHGLPLKSRRD